MQITSPHSNMIALFDNEESSGGPRRRLRGALSRVGFGLIGFAGLVFGALPIFAARRLLYPVTHEPPPYTEEGLIDVPVRPERVEFMARDGKPLSGWFVPAPDGTPKPWSCVVLIYGYGGYKEQMHEYAKMVHEGGFATLMFDMRGAGLRRREPVTLGYKERWDLMDAVRYIQTRSDVDPNRIGAFGLSMGGAVAIMAAAEEPGIKAIVTDSAYADITDMIKPGIVVFLGKLALPFAPLIVRYAETMMGIRAHEIRPEKAASKLGERPLFVIHGLDDALTHPQSAYKIYQAATGPKELWLLPECGHGCAPSVAPAEYKRRINEFFSRWL
ncbi:MAG TPA: alpha/beta fold hydrolase [Chloroflexia bacterium]|nr:alpha/beta fold hydrolase [Chloroflexia bacterium]